MSAEGPRAGSTAESTAATGAEQTVSVPAGRMTLDGTLALPAEPRGVVLFAHGSGSSRHSPRNRYVAEVLRGSGLGTLLVDLLNPIEEREDLRTRAWRFDISLLAERLVAAIQWLGSVTVTRMLRVGLFGASTGAAAALVAAAGSPNQVAAVVSRGGRPDLAGNALPLVRSPTLLIVGGDDEQVLELNHLAMAAMRAPVHLEIVHGAGHLFEEPGTLEEVARLARSWFVRYLGEG